ncbi:MAG: hypothetical protein F9K49_05620 [Caedimonadaceae bacterium]|nr:MAG: hypothetical protein F9K49_05620 [Caedimonadaceae bacterium]
MENISRTLFQSNVIIKFSTFLQVLIFSSPAVASKFIDYDATGNPLRAEYTSPRGKKYTLSDRTMDLRNSPSKQLWQCESKKNLVVVDSDSIETSTPLSSITDCGSAATLIPMDGRDQGDIIEKSVADDVLIQAPSVVENAEKLMTIESNELYPDASGPFAHRASTEKSVNSFDRVRDSESILKDRYVRPYRRMAEFFEENPDWSSLGPTHLPEELKRNFKNLQTLSNERRQNMVEYFQELQEQNDQENYID